MLGCSLSAARHPQGRSGLHMYGAKLSVCGFSECGFAQAMPPSTHGIKRVGKSRLQIFNKLRRHVNDLVIDDGAWVRDRNPHDRKRGLPG